MSIKFVVSLCFGAVLTAAASTTATQAPARRTVEVSTDEGSWMSVDVSADGKTVIFDLLGRLYSVPIDGGQAQPVGPQDEGWDLCPRFSPDGSRVAFLSNREGFTDLWIMDWKTRQSRRLSEKELWSLKEHEKHGVSRYGFACSPHWLSDGSTLAAIPSTRSDRFTAFFLAEGEGAHKRLELAPIEGSGFTVPTAIVPLHEAERAAAAITTHLATGSRRDLFWLHLDDGKLNPLRDQMARGFAFNPELSRSGRFLAYILRENKDDSTLRIRDLTNGNDRKLAALTEIDEFVQEQELPGYAFTPDDRFIVIAYGGKLHKIEVSSGKDQVIPFQAKVVRSVANRVRATQRLADGPVQVKSQRWPSISQDGGTLAFSAAGSLWVRQLPDGKPRTLGSSTTLNTMPALSQDGRRVAYVSFAYSQDTIAAPGRLLIQKLDSAQPVAAIDDDASYYWPTWSPDQSKLAVVRKPSGEGAAQIGWIDVAKKTFQPLVDAPHYVGQDFRGGAPRWLAWSSDGQRLFFQTFQEWGHDFRASVDVMEIRLGGTATRVIAQGGSDVYAIVPSPDMKHAVVIGWDQNAYVIALPEPGATPLQVTLTLPGIKRVSEVGALHPRWMSHDRFTYGWTDRLFEYRLGAPAAIEKTHTDLELPRRQGDGVLAFKNARLITMAGERGVGPVIEQGTIVIKDRRIVALGAVAEVQIPEAARVIDATGLTIMPGLVDTHYHALNPETLAFYTPGNSVSGGAKALAFGITTPFEAGGGSVDEASDDWRVMMESGRVPGPRWRFDSVIDTHYLRPAPDRMSLEEQRAQIRRKQDLGEGPCLKEIGDRDFIQARWRAQAAAAEGGCVVAHVEDHLMHSLSRMAEGIPLHHNTLPVPMYRDVQQFLLKSDVSWTPHMELQWHIDFPQELQARDTLPEVLAKLDRIMDADDRARFERFYLQGKFANRIEAARKLPTDTFARSRRPALTKVAKTLLEGGMHMTLSGHDAFGAPLRGEMLVWQDGGIPREYILRAATRGGAEQLGYQNDIGSLAPGMVADLLVLKANPLEDVLNSFRLKWTVVDGAVFDSTTLKRVN
jgi:Tol biopolymer transport system component